MTYYIINKASDLKNIRVYAFSTSYLNIKQTLKLLREQEPSLNLVILQEHKRGMF